MKHLDPDKIFSSSVKMRFNFLIAFLLILYWGLNDFSWTGLLFGYLSYATIGKVGGDVALHRYFSHRSFKTNWFWDRLLKITSVMIGHGSMFLWAITHRAHHKDSDTSLDPHPPNIAGFLSVFLRTWSGKFTPSAKFGKDLIHDSEIMFIHKHYFKLFYSWIILSFLISPSITLYLFAFPCFGFFIETGLVNTICHRYGYRKYNTNDQSTNNVFVNWITLGNGMHNTHHAKQSINTNDIHNKWYEFDVMKYLIRVIKI